MYIHERVLQLRLQMNFNGFISNWFISRHSTIHSFTEKLKINENFQTPLKITTCPREMAMKLNMAWQIIIIQMLAIRYWIKSRMQKLSSAAGTLKGEQINRNITLGTINWLWLGIKTLNLAFLCPTSSCETLFVMFDRKKQLKPYCTRSYSHHNSLFLLSLDSNAQIHR